MAEEIVLEVFKDGEQIDEFRLDLTKASYTVGKQGDVQLKHPSCSRRHAELTLRQGARGIVLEVTDLGSTHGTFLDGDKLPQQRPVPLLPDQELSFGASTRKFKLSAESTSLVEDGDGEDDGEARSSLFDTSNETYDEALMRALLYILRGDPKSNYGIYIRPDGYVKVDDISNSSSMQTYRCSESDIRALVEAREEHFQLMQEGGHIFIRATSGHSPAMVCPVDLSLRITEMGGAVDTLVHGTNFRCWNSIENDGLRPPASILSFVSKVPSKGEVLKGMKKTAEVLVFIDMTLAMQEGGVRFYRDEKGFIVSAGHEATHTISPIYFKKVLNARDGSLLLSESEIASMRVRERERAEVERKRRQIATARELKAKQEAEERAAAKAKKQEKASKVNPYLAHLQNEEEEDEEEDEGEWEDSRKKKKIRLADE